MLRIPAFLVNVTELKAIFLFLTNRWAVIFVQFKEIIKWSFDEKKTQFFQKKTFVHIVHCCVLFSRITFFVVFKVAATFIGELVNSNQVKLFFFSDERLQHFPLEGQRLSHRIERPEVGALQPTVRHTCLLQQFAEKLKINYLPWNKMSIHFTIIICIELRI